MFDEISSMGERSKNQIKKLNRRFLGSDSEVEKFDICTQLSLAEMSIKLKKALKKPGPALDPEDEATLKKARDFCKGVYESVKEFEMSWDDSDISFLAQGVKGSLVPLKKSVFSHTGQCSQSDFDRLIQIDSEKYGNSSVIASTLMMITINEGENMRVYLPRYKELIRRNSPKRAKLISYFVEKSMEQYSQPGSQSQNQSRLKRSMLKLQENGVDDIGQFIAQSIKTSPECFSRIGSGIMDQVKIYNKSYKESL